MKCQKCGKALSNEQPTCLFCGTFISKEQISTFVNMKKEKSKDTRPKLISEKYGMEPIQYQINVNRTNSKAILILNVCAFLVILFLVLVFIFL